MRFWTLLLLLNAWASMASAQSAELLQAYARTSGVTGREEEASRFVESLFKAGTLQHDRLGNIVLVLGSGSPRRLLVAPLDEPGYVVSQIEENGYLRVAPVGGGALVRYSINFWRATMYGLSPHAGP